MGRTEFGEQRSYFRLRWSKMSYQTGLVKAKINRLISEKICDFKKNLIPS